MSYAERISSKYNSIITSILDEGGQKYSKHGLSGGYNYHIESDEVVVEVKINPKWIGYELLVKRGVLGKGIGALVDTDNYPLEYDPEVTEEIANETIQCVKAFLSKAIYIGKNGGKCYLAVPSGENYKFSSRGRFIADVSEVTKDTISNNKELRRIR